ncbi:PEP-CTERM sorting domain-containing protein [Duganella sp. CY42W]|uniref:PEP-CTERM sorting domain-containing protein n=2 Tax=Duganella levis TaxID=2692169 RepID=A0ABW9VV09_9BURK|nr:PEP-CTERM sorting domain-containing protein [Duganella levis]
MLLSTAASAAPTPTFNITPGDAPSFTANYGNSFSKLDYNHTFDDKFYFAINRKFTSSADLTASYLGKSFDLSITALQLVSYNPATHAVIHTYGGSNDTLPNSKKDEWSFDLGPLASGSYYMEVKGKVLGTSGGSYGGTLNVAAVPEPETYGMLLAGLGLLGAVARRRPKQA